jgi:hypothetical protein
VPQAPLITVSSGREDDQVVIEVLDRAGVLVMEDLVDQVDGAPHATPIDLGVIEEAE